ncbi:MAG: hypothetical protein IKS98_03175, partial [Lachnospiraceae bacterium]|nr:hypothetical protein [Lachnospiraceae bacterium]
CLAGQKRALAFKYAAAKAKVDALLKEGKNAKLDTSDKCKWNHRLAFWLAEKDRAFSEEKPEKLAEARHNYELEKCDSNVICVDWKMAGVGSNACGPALAEKYRIPIPEFSANLRFKPIR